MTVEYAISLIAILVLGVICIYLSIRVNRLEGRTPDGIIAVSNKDGKIRANFILCIPTDKFLEKSVVIFNVKHLDDLYSQETQDLE